MLVMFCLDIFQKDLELVTGLLKSLKRRTDLNLKIKVETCWSRAEMDLVSEWAGVKPV
jgi:hypothetical protein